VTPNEERRFLRRIAKQLDTPPRSRVKSFLVQIGLGLSLVLGLFLVTHFGRALSQLAQLFVAAMAGAAFVLLFMDAQSKRLWQILSALISRDSLAKRLQELGDP
jgi:hypothetical protein